MKISSLNNFISRRSPVLSKNGCVASSQPAATQAGIKILESGGNAADAAVAVAAALQVTQACSTGLGGDAFFLYYEASTKKVTALNGSGRSASALTIEKMKKRGYSGRIPMFDSNTVTVPGAPAAWEDIIIRHGNLPLTKILAPAIKLASEGFVMAPMTSIWWRWGAEKQLSKTRHGHELMNGGRGLNAGQLVRNPALADSLSIFAENGSKPFYSGRIAEAVIAAVRETGGCLSAEDLENHKSEWIDPISVEYRDKTVWECPPNGQGLAALIAINIMQYIEPAEAGSADRYHQLIESMRIGFADAAKYIGDPDFSFIPIEELLSGSYGEKRAGEINMFKAGNPDPGMVSLSKSTGTDTVYFCTVDNEGNGCSFINSNFMGFGTGIVPEGCGYSLQNRGHGFLLEDNHINSLKPGKRPYHTIIPGLITNNDNSLNSVFGVMGGMMQPQGHLQVVSAMLDDGVDPQAALDLPRFQLESGESGGNVLIEDAVGTEVIEMLIKKGHKLKMITGSERAAFGLGQIICIDPEQTRWAGSDGRGDGCALAVFD